MLDFFFPQDERPLEGSDGFRFVFEGERDHHAAIRRRERRSGLSALPRARRPCRYGAHTVFYICVY